MGDEFFAASFAEFKSLGCEGAALELLREGLAAHPSSAVLLKLAKQEGVEVPAAAPPPAEAPSGASSPSPAVPPAAAQSVQAKVDEWRPPPPPHPNKERIESKKGTKDFWEAIVALSALVEADTEAWAKKRQQDLTTELQRLRTQALHAFAESRKDLSRLNIDARPELLRWPCHPDTASRAYEACNLGGAEAVLREAAGECPAAFGGEIWNTEGPGAYLQHSRRMSVAEAPLARARDIARSGCGTVHELLSAIAREVAVAVKALPDRTAQVLVIGGHGASAVTAARAGASKVVVWEGQRFVAMVAREVLRRNLTGEELGRCSVAHGQPPEGTWDVVAIDLWHGCGALAWGPLEALRVLQSSARVIPSKLWVEVALADARLCSASGFDLSRLDARFRGLCLMPLHLNEPGSEHPTALSPSLLTDVGSAFEWDLQGGLTSKEEPTVPLQLRGTQSGVASLAVLSLKFQVGHEGPMVLQVGQWMPGGLCVADGEAVPGLSARRGPGRVWVDWDWGRAEEPPFGYMQLGDWYYEMLRDSARHDLYDRAIQAEVAAVKSGGNSRCRVLDVGSGDGILSMMALRAGATAVVGVEVVTAIARLSEEIVGLNRPRPGRSEAPLPPADEAPFDVWCTDVRGVSRPPEHLRFDVLVSELMDASGLGENLILLSRGARERLCRDGAPVIPARLRLLAVLCELRFPSLADVNLDAFWPFWPSGRFEEGLWVGVDLDKGEGDFHILTEPTELLSFDLGFADVGDVPPRKDHTFSGTADGTANCVVWWFEAQLSKADPSIVLTNAPKCVDRRHAATCWGQAMAELRSPMTIKQGAAAEVIMEVPFGDYQLKFRPRVTAESTGGGPAASPAHGSEPPPGSPPYSDTFADDMKAYRDFRREMRREMEKNKIGRTAFGAADVPALGVLQRCALSMASQPFLFGLEPSIAAKMLARWYSVGGEGRN